MLFQVTDWAMVPPDNHRTLFVRVLFVSLTGAPVALDARSTEHMVLPLRSLLVIVVGTAGPDMFRPYCVLPEMVFPVIDGVLFSTLIPDKALPVRR